MRLFENIKNYFYGLYERFTSAQRRDQGLVVGGVVGGTYASLRAICTVAELNVPLAGRVAIANPAARAAVGLFVGVMGGSTFGNRYGQISEAFEGTARDMVTGPDGEMNNLTFMMKTWPLLVSIAANAVIFALPVAGGNPIFATVKLLSKPELVILTTGNGAFVGGTIAHRIGKSLDVVTGGTLVADFGLYSGYRYVRRKIKACTVPKAITPDERQPLLGPAPH